MSGETTTVNKKTVTRLDAYERRYRALAAQLADIGYIASGTLAPRYNRCGKPNCACRADPPRLHGPYWHFTTKIEGKTVNRRLSPRRHGDDAIASYQRPRLLTFDPPVGVGCRTRRGKSRVPAL